MTIKLLHIYYDIMNLYGEYANMLILKKHIEDQGFEVILDKKTINEDIDFESYDFIYMGSGTENNQLVVLKDIRKYRDVLQNIVNNKVMLFTGNSYELLGKSITNFNNEYIEVLNIFNFETKIINGRVTSDIVYDSEYFDKNIVGFINKSSNIYNNENHLFKVKYGIGDNEKNDYEGIKYNNFYGTHVIGPIFIKNPEILKQIVINICTNANKDFEYKEIEYLEENNSYNLVLSELEKRFRK